MLIFFLTTICTAEDAAALTAFIINISGRCCTAVNDTNCAADGCSELDHQHKKHQTSLRSAHTQQRGHRGMAKHFLSSPAVLISHHENPYSAFFLSSMNTDSHQHRANTEREAQLNMAGSLCRFPCSLCHKALRWASAGKALLGENKLNVDKEKVNSSWIMMSYALNLWLLEIHTLLSCYLSPLVWDTQCHKTTEFLFSGFAFSCSDATLIKFSNSAISCRHPPGLTPWPESVCLNPTSIHTLLCEG